MKLIKLDRRMNGYGDFKYMCKKMTGIHYELDDFFAIRNWCWETWGPSYELNFYKKNITKNPAWCWHVFEYEARIYLAGDEEANWFMLKWL